MRILVTGVSGLDRARAWGRLEAPTIVDLGGEMLRLAAERQMDLDEDNILHTGQDTLSALRAAALAQVINRQPTDAAPVIPLIISTHSVFARLDGLAEGLLPADITEIKPDLWVTLIDGPQAIEEKLRTHQAEYLRLELSDIVKWQELEVFFSHHLATENRIRHCVVPVSQPEVLAALAGGDQRQIAYASYPMSHAPKEAKRQIARFVQRLKKYFIVFDPGSVESAHGTKPRHSEKDRKAIGSHTIVRDLDWFIRINADTVVAYWPAVIFSSGMSDELRFAYEIGRKTILVTERSKEGGLPLLSPFMTYKARVFWSSHEFFSFLRLPQKDQRLYTLFQAVMAEEFRAHDTGATKLTPPVFTSECSRMAEYRLGEDFGTVTQERLRSIASLVYKSWKPMLARASPRGRVQHQGRLQQVTRPANERMRRTAHGRGHARQRRRRR